MSVNKVRYPGAGCVVEFMQGNSPMLALVLEEQGGRLRLYTQGRRETNLPAARLLPWSGPSLGTGLSRQRIDEALEEHRILRAGIAAEVSFLDVWELTQGEVEKTSAEWLAGLVWEQPTIDQEAALGHALLAAKTHFRFTPPDFEIYSQEVMESRMAEAENTRLREAMALAGASFFRLLWDVFCRRRGPLAANELPDEELAARLKNLLLARLADPESSDDSGAWKQLVKSLPESPHMPLYLATAWELVPEHYNFWLDRAGFDRGEAWADAFATECDALRDAVAQAVAPLTVEDPGFVSVDPITTHDRDDAFFVERDPDGGYRVQVALACPALVWPFGGPLDKTVLRRTSSLYLPEGDEHMLPARIGWQLFSLDAGQVRPAFVLSLRINAAGDVEDIQPRITAVRMRANLDLVSCQSILEAFEDEEGEATGSAAGDALLANSAAVAQTEAGAHAPMLQVALELARLLQAKRIAAGAVITERPDPEVTVEGEGELLRVRITEDSQPHLAHLVVGELMVLSNSALAGWAIERSIPLLYRTQDVALPREFAGVWTEPHEISRVVRALPPASLEASARRHAGLGLTAYATVSSPIRRYVDLLNQGQVASWLQTGSPRLGQEDLAGLLPLLSARQDAVTQVQRYRPRYWKLLFFRQQGDKKWWDGVVTDENEAFVTVSMPWAQLMVRGRRNQFEEKTYPGQQVQIRIGKVSPLLNEIQILEVREG